MEFFVKQIENRVKKYVTNITQTGTCFFQKHYREIFEPAGEKVFNLFFCCMHTDELQCERRNRNIYIRSIHHQHGSDTANRIQWFETVRVDLRTPENI